MSMSAESGFRSSGLLSLHMLAVLASLAGFQTSPPLATSACAASQRLGRDFGEERGFVQVGADLVAGSLIKGVGGTLAVGGGYIAGRQDLVAACAARLTAPGIGIDSGCVSGDVLRLMMQGTTPPSQSYAVPLHFPSLFFNFNLLFYVFFYSTDRLYSLLINL